MGCLQSVGLPQATGCAQLGAHQCYPQVAHTADSYATSPDLPIKVGCSGETQLRMAPEGAVFLPVALAKQSNLGRAIKEFFFPRFAENAMLCPVHSLSLYLERTRQFRGSVNQMFIAIIRFHLPGTSFTIAWLKEVSVTQVLTPIYLKLIFKAYN